MSSASNASDWNLPRSLLLSLNVFPVQFSRCDASAQRPQLSFRFREPSKRYRSTSALFELPVSISIGLTAYFAFAWFACHVIQRFLTEYRPKDLIGSSPRQPLLPRKEVIQPHLPIRLPCYDFTPVIGLTFGSWLLAVTSLTSGAPNSHGVTGGVYKARERIHRGMLIRDY